ncbi:hypothetical protein [Vibrio agarivorans]|uniref:Uncharacterized protein n=1 Tax=Vibrio agarivorans TaxID=153622 RepID=A0ABT7Y5R2_9VIBR|nr:hypothetical protein [Vibrio agarivorans]MDN2483347.1 hypothetical protein [Vibrio agarivorans]
MFRQLGLSVLLVSSFTAWACGLHQSTGFNMVIEEGSLDVFARVIDVRQSNEFNNADKPDHFRLYSLRSALAEPSDNKLDFAIFEAVKGHYSEVIVNESVLVTGMNEFPGEDDLLVVTELDILDALASGLITWQQANERNLVRVNGPESKKQQLDEWFNQLFDFKENE